MWETSSGTRPPRAPAFLRWGSWIGGDRDGNPEVTAEVTEKTLRIHADHVLRGYEAVATRHMQTLAAAVSADRVARPIVSRLARDAEDLPETDRQLRRRFPDEPYRQRFGFIAERLRRTRAALTGEARPLSGRYASPADLDAELVEIQEALVADGLERVAWGEIAELRWQLVSTRASTAPRSRRSATGGPNRRRSRPVSRSAKSSPRSGRSPRSRGGSGWTAAAGTS